MAADVAISVVPGAAVPAGEAAPGVAPESWPSANVSPRRDRIRELDSLRGLAALAVVLFHYTSRYPELFECRRLVPFDFVWGQYGVDLFFMISGFVIFMTLDRTRHARHFAVGRFARLYPAYWVAVIGTYTIVCAAGLPGQEVSLFEAALNLTMVQGLFGARHVDGAYWSLQVELLFYVVMLALHRSRLLRAFPQVLAAWLILAAAAQVALAWLDGLSLVAWVVPKVQTLFNLRYIHLFGIGMILYQGWLHGRLSGALRLLLAACLAQHALVDSPAAAVLIAALAALVQVSVAGTVGAANLDAARRLLRARALVFLGTISYSLYLVHQNIGYVALRGSTQYGVPGWAALPAAVGLAVALAVLLTRLVEQPALRRIKQVLEPRRKPLSGACLAA
jgi:peptidoglycan/LPS O-acetylase OafA/YrhL